MVGSVTSRNRYFRNRGFGLRICRIGSLARLSILPDSAARSLRASPQAERHRLTARASNNSYTTSWDTTVHRSALGTELTDDRSHLTWTFLRLQTTERYAAPRGGLGTRICEPPISEDIAHRCTISGYFGVPHLIQSAKRRRTDRLIPWPEEMARQLATDRNLSTWRHRSSNEGNSHEETAREPWRCTGKEAVVSLVRVRNDDSENARSRG